MDKLEIYTKKMFPNLFFEIGGKIVLIGSGLVVDKQWAYTRNSKTHNWREC